MNAFIKRHRIFVHGEAVATDCCIGRSDNERQLPNDAHQVDVVDTFLPASHLYEKLSRFIVRLLQAEPVFSFGKIFYGERSGATVVAVEIHTRTGNICLYSK